jgi:hypothetical protein
MQFLEPAYTVARYDAHIERHGHTKIEEEMAIVKTE